MRMSVADGASVKAALKWKHNAVSKRIQAIQGDHAGLLQIAERIPQTHQPGAQASTRCVTDAHLLNYLRLLYAALRQIGHRFRMALKLDLIEVNYVAQQRADARPTA